MSELSVIYVNFVIMSILWKSTVEKFFKNAKIWNFLPHILKMTSSCAALREQFKTNRFALGQF